VFSKTLAPRNDDVYRWYFIRSYTNTNGGRFRRILYGTNFIRSPSLGTNFIRERTLLCTRQNTFRSNFIRVCRHPRFCAFQNSPSAHSRDPKHDRRPALLENRVDYLSNGLTRGGRFPFAVFVYAFIYVAI